MRERENLSQIATAALQRRDMLRAAGAAGAAGLALATGGAWAQGASGWPTTPARWRN